MRLMQSSKQYSARRRLIAGSENVQLIILLNVRFANSRIRNTY